MMNPQFPGGQYGQGQPQLGPGQQGAPPGQSGGMRQPMFNGQPPGMDVGTVSYG